MKAKTYPNMDSLEGASDGIVKVIADRTIKNFCFSSEQELSDFIERNINSFCKDILKDELVKYSKEHPITPQLRLSRRERRVDFLLTCKRKEYIIELKNPTHYADNRYAIGQLLDYGRELRKDMVLITTKFDVNTARTIKHFNIPIRYIYLDKTRSMEFMDYE